MYNIIEELRNFLRGGDLIEETLVKLLLQRDERGAELLLSHFAPLMRYIIAPILPNPHDQEECLSEVVLRVWEKIHTYDPERGKFRPWLTAVTRNTALNFLRKGEEADPLSPELPAPSLSPEEIVLQKERRELLQNALRQLTAKEQVLFYRKYYYLQSTVQIAAEMGTTERAIEGKLYRMKKKLRKLLGGDENA